MPKGFLVKRHKPLNLSTVRRRGSEDDLSDNERSGSEQEEPAAPKILCPLLPTDSAQFRCSPDSGYANSPGSVNIATLKDDENLLPRGRPEEVSPRSDASSSSQSPNPSPFPVHAPSAALGSAHGFPFASFDKLRMCASQQQRIGPAGPLFPGLPLFPPAALHPSANYLPHAALNFAIPPHSLHAPLLMPAPHSPFKATSRILSPVNAPQAHMQQTLISNPFNMVQSPNKKRPAVDPIAQEAPAPKAPKSKKMKAQRKIHFDEDKSSPVSGTIIRDAPTDDGYKVCSGDIDSSLNLVEVTPEARAELEKIENKIGDYICQLCRDKFEDAFQLAQHKCSRIVHVEYRCPECDKVFNCPANLASHRRWHKPRPNGSSQGKGGSQKTMASSPVPKAEMTGGPFVGMYSAEERGTSPGGSSSAGSDVGSDAAFECKTCRRRFKREAYLRKHEATHHAAPMAPMPAMVPETFCCHYCGEQLKTEAARTKHILQMHTPGLGGLHHQHPVHRPPMNSMMPPRPIEDAFRPEQALHCKFCPSVFFTSPSLTRHINKCHPSENRQVMLLPTKC